MTVIRILEAGHGGVFTHFKSGYAAGAAGRSATLYTSSGDAYVDHPSFGHAIISRVLEDAGYKVGIISQPDWKNRASISALGRPRLGFLVMAGTWTRW